MSKIEVIDTIKPVNSQDFPVAEANDILGGVHLVADTTARDAIPSFKRQEGMIAFVTSESKSYRLEGGITNGDWIAEDYLERYTHVQSPASATWTITHNLGRNPILSVYQGSASDGNLLYPFVEISTNGVQVILRFSESIVGVAYLK